MTDPVAHAVAILKQGGVIAYPTEHCFGLGCDPSKEQAVRRVLEIKQRRADQGLILIAADLDQIGQHADIEASPIKPQILKSWPGPITWLLPAHKTVPRWIRGKHSTVAMRVTDHPTANQLCALFGAAIVSTSANRHGQPALLTGNDVVTEMGDEVDFVLDEPVGGAAAPSQILDGVTGERLR